jgi:hypothetical protein
LVSCECKLNTKSKSLGIHRDNVLQAPMETQGRQRQRKRSWLRPPYGYRLRVSGFPTRCRPKPQRGGLFIVGLEPNKPFFLFFSGASTDQFITGAGNSGRLRYPTECCTTAPLKNKKKAPMGMIWLSSQRVRLHSPREINLPGSTFSVESIDAKSSKLQPPIPVTTGLKLEA